ncbi:hypothetical protein E2C01_041582 [Portunus trituberculatus]|uniref:Uncharacterized protein n=1 Tax=Portunus trituberculatus TaxID=210409 RepID=A0A5B7FU38_PORTR|nr:hypothetical protein [Portunus trituberculatus]
MTIRSQAAAGRVPRRLVTMTILLLCIISLRVPPRSSRRDRIAGRCSKVDWEELGFPWTLSDWQGREGECGNVWPMTSHNWLLLPPAAHIMSQVIFQSGAACGMTLGGSPNSHQTLRLLPYIYTKPTRHHLTPLDMHVQNMIKNDLAGVYHEFAKIKLNKIGPKVLLRTQQFRRVVATLPSRPAPPPRHTLTSTGISVLGFLFRYLPLLL